MDILHSLNVVRTNRKAYESWQKEQDLNDEKRKELANQKPASKDELKNASNMGKSIIDAVDIMDQHSEDVAQNIETATNIPNAVIPMTVGGITTLLVTKIFLKPLGKKTSAYDKKFREENESLKSLIKDLRTKNNKEYYSYYNFMSKREIRKLKLSPEDNKRALMVLNEYKQGYKKLHLKSKIGMFAAAPFITAGIALIAGAIYSAKMQVSGSKIARFQARKVLNDPKYFVYYTPEQIAQGEENLKNKNNKKHKLKTDDLKSGFFSSIKSILKDKSAYNEWEKNYNVESKKVQRPLSDEELDEAKRNQEVIQRVERKINNNAENYSQQMEVAAGIIIGATPVLGWGVGRIVSAITNKLKVFDKFTEKVVNEYTNIPGGNEDLKKAYETIKNQKKNASAKEKTQNFFNFLGEMIDAQKDKAKETNLKDFDINPKITKTSFLDPERIRRITAALLVNKTARNKVLGFVGGFVSGIVGGFIALKLEKASSRAGRYVAKRELDKDDKNFVGYTKEEFDSVSVKTPKKESKVKEYAMFLPRVFKNYFAYQHYKKHELKHNRELKEELIKMDFSPEQMRQAKNLQRKVFNTFEQVDDKSQDYSESVEAFFDVAQPLTFVAGSFAAIAPLIIGSIKMGKIYQEGFNLTPKKLKNFVSILTKISDKLGSKGFKKYLNNVAAQAPSRFNQRDYFIPIKKLFNGKITKDMLNINEIQVSKIAAVLEKNVENIENYEAREVLDSLSFIFKKDKDIDSRKQLISALHEIAEGNITLTPKEIKELIECKSSIKLDSINEVIESSKAKVKKLNENEFKKVIKEIQENLIDSNIILSNEGKDFTKEILIENMDKVGNIIKKLPKEEVSKIAESLVEAFRQNPDKVIKSVKDLSIFKIFITDNIKKAAVAAGVSWVALQVVIMYAVQSWLAELKLKAGRLGVMKAMETLNSPAYYADAETKNTTVQNPEPKTAVA